MSFIKSWFSSPTTSPSGTAAAQPQQAGELPPGVNDKEPIPEAEADEVLPENNKSLLAQLISANGLSIGMDLSKIVLPTFILEPRSLLQKLGDCMAHAEFFADIPNAETPELRMVKTVAWFLTAHHKRPKGVKKPYNPVLGETFHARYIPTHTVDGQPVGVDSHGVSTAAVEWYAQQVSHHPPISAMLARSTDGRVIAEGVFAPRTRFLGNSASLTPDGCCNLFLPEHDWEMYSISWPIAYVRGLIMGSMLQELGGVVRVRCQRTGMGADIEFVTKGMFTGKYHQIQGTIWHAEGEDMSKHKVLYKVEGSWTEAFTIREAAATPSNGGGGGGGKVVFSFDVNKSPVSKTDTLASDGRTPVLDASATAAAPSDDSDLKCSWDAVATWKKVTDAIEKGDQEAATTTKTEVENHQRRLRTRREEKKIEYVPDLFRPGEMFKAANGNTFQLWHFTGPGALPLLELAGLV